MFCKYFHFKFVSYEMLFLLPNIRVLLRWGDQPSRQVLQVKVAIMVLPKDAKSIEILTNF